MNGKYETIFTILAENNNKGNKQQTQIVCKHTKIL